MTIDSGLQIPWQSDAPIEKEGCEDQERNVGNKGASIGEEEAGESRKKGEDEWRAVPVGWIFRTDQIVVINIQTRSDEVAGRLSRAVQPFEREQG